jgi:hypothetical protein
MRGLKRRRMFVIVLGLGWAAAASPALADIGGAPPCTWQPVVHGLRHLMPPADLEARELNCGIADPVDLSPEIATTVERLGESLRAASGDR